LIGGFDCVQTRERESAGGASSVGELWGDDEKLNWLLNEARKSVREMRCVKGGRLGEAEELAVTDGGEISQRCSQMLRSLASDFVALRWNRRERKREAREESRGLL
jgi:hypothetical protein